MNAGGSALFGPAFSKALHFSRKLRTAFYEEEKSNGHPLSCVCVLGCVQGSNRTLVADVWSAPEPVSAADRIGEYKLLIHSRIANHGPPPTLADCPAPHSTLLGANRERILKWICN